MGLLLLLLLFADSNSTACVPQSDQASVQSDPFRAVPVESRDDVRASFDLIVKLYKEQQWGKVYDLLDQYRHDGISREQYIRARESHADWTLLDFTPTRVMPQPAGRSGWYVNGCALVDDHGKKNKWESIVDVLYENGRKRIYLTIGLKKSGGIMPCLQPTATPH